MGGGLSYRDYGYRGFDYDFWPYRRLRIYDESHYPYQRVKSDRIWKGHGSDRWAFLYWMGFFIRNFTQRVSNNLFRVFALPVQPLLSSKGQRRILKVLFSNKTFNSNHFYYTF